MFIESEKAKAMKCCTQEKFCEGPACMAWRWQYVEARAYSTSGGLATLAPPKKVQTNSGRCGLAGGVNE